MDNVSSGGSCAASTTTASLLLLDASVSNKICFVVLSILAFPTAVWLLLYLLPQIYMAFRPVPNLKKKYDATWALVTGGGSGIGKALAFHLASQGLNVVIVSLDDQFLKETIAEIQKVYPNQQFRSIGVTFAPDIKYMDIISKAIVDIEKDIRIVFCNAGYMVTGFCDQTPINKLLANIECNATSGVVIAHYFVQKMVQSKQVGCIVFTSSVAGFIPTPFAAMYASTKAFVSQFAACLHIEVKPLGIDVCAIHPSPVASNFYSNLTHKVDMIEAAAKNAVQPTQITADIFRSIGCCALRDLGALAWGTRIGTFFIPYNFFTELFTFAAPFMPDWKNHNKNR